MRGCYLGLAEAQLALGLAMDAVASFATALGSTHTRCSKVLSVLRYR